MCLYYVCERFITNTGLYLLLTSEVLLPTSSIRLLSIIHSVNDVLLLIAVEHVLTSIDVILFHLLELVGISCANEVALHVVYVAVGVHQVLLLLALNLDPTHHHVVLDVHALLFLLITSRILLLHVECLILWLLHIPIIVVVVEDLLMLILLLHLVRRRGSAHKPAHHIVIVVVTLRLVILHLQQVIVLLLRVAIRHSRYHCLSLLLLRVILLLLLLNHVKPL
jgi:hypothetical protein